VTRARLRPGRFTFSGRSHFAVTRTWAIGCRPAWPWAGWSEVGLLADLLGQPYQKSFGPTDVAEPIDIFVSNHLAPVGGPDWAQAQLDGRPALGRGTSM